MVFELCFGVFVFLGLDDFCILIRQFAVFDSYEEGFLLRHGECFLCFCCHLDIFHFQFSAFLMRVSCVFLLICVYSKGWFELFS